MTEPARRKPSDHHTTESLTSKCQPPKAAGAAYSVAGGAHPVVKAAFWDCSGVRPDFYTANCPSCQSTIKVVLGAVTICRSCGTSFFAEAAA